MLSCRVSTTSLISGACVVGSRGLGALGATVRSETGIGTHGAGYLYNDWEAGDDDKEFRGLIVTPPASGTLVAYENGGFNLTGAADGSYTLTYRLFVDGADLGTATASIFVGTTDSTLPTLTGSITVGTVTSTSIQITWPVGADDVAVSGYETSINGGAWTDRGTALTCTFTGLSAGISYTMQVRSKDASGNVSTPAVSVTQLTVSDTPPDPPAVVTSTARQLMVREMLRGVS